MDLRGEFGAASAQFFLPASSLTPSGAFANVTPELTVRFSLASLVDGFSLEQFRWKGVASQPTGAPRAGPIRLTLPR